MMVNGPLEIYGTVIGIKLFDAMFNILASCGAVHLSLVFMFFINITKPYENEIENGASTSLRRVRIHFMLWVFTVMLFVAPTHSVDISAITYKPMCTPSALLSRLDDTGTTYDDTFKEDFAHLNYQEIKIPIMMSLMLTGMSGFTNAAIASLPCKTDVQALKGTIDTTRLTPQLQQQVGRFNAECFAPAKAKFTQSPPDKSRYENMLNNYGGQSDLSWMGSHVFQSLYYDNLYPSSPVSGFPAGQFPGQYQSFNSKSGVPQDAWGYPTCNEWWNDSSYGIKQQLVDLVGKHSPTNPHLGNLSFLERMQAWVAKTKQFTHLGSQVTAEDVIARDLLYDKGSNAGFGANYGGWMDDNADYQAQQSLSLRLLTGTLATAGQATSAAMSSISRAEVATEIPILQSVLIALSLTIGPMVILIGMFSGYGISVILTYYFLVSSFYFMTFVEKFVHYFEMSLHASQSYGLYAMGNSMEMYNIFTKLYFYAPMLYLMMMSVAGIKIGGAVGSSLSDSVSGAGADFAKKAAGYAAEMV